MTVEKLREVLQTRPFKAFTLHVADGRSVGVEHPDFISVSPSGRIVHVFYKDDRSEFVDLLLVTSIELGNAKPRRTRRR